VKSSHVYANRALDIRCVLALRLKKCGLGVARDARGVDACCAVCVRCQTVDSRVKR